MRQFSLLVAASACTGCVGWQSALDPHSIQAESLSQLIVLLVIVCTIVWVLVIAVLLTALLRRSRRSSEDGTRIAAAIDRRMTVTISAALVATLVVVVSLTVASFVATRRISADDPHALVVQVRGWQWWWEVTYPDPSPDHQFSTANEIHVPVGRPIRVELSAADVIHSFWVPNLAGKQDMIPGRDNRLSFTARQAGTYRGQCAEFCGMQHAHMALVIVADEPAAYEAWKAAQLAEAVHPAGDEEAAGQRVFMRSACRACHTVRGTAAAGTNGPDLTHVGSRRTIGAGLFETTRGSLAAWTADPQTLKPGNNMPMVELRPDELNAVSAYLAGLR